MQDVCCLYVENGAKVADVTYGKGSFWKKVNTTRFVLDKSDKLMKEAPYDFRKLPYKDEIYDHVVFDPPYMHNAGKPLVDARYRNSETTKGRYHNDIMQLYRQGMKEGKRILKVGGMLWVKCQDQIESGYQRWSHIEIYREARNLGMFGKDLFVLASRNMPIQRKQQHARKNHSYLWIFMKPAAKQERDIARYGIF